MGKYIRNTLINVIGARNKRKIDWETRSQGIDKMLTFFIF